MTGQGKHSAVPGLRAVDTHHELCVGPLISAHALLAMKPLTPLVEGVMALGHVGAIAGEYGSGKTFAALDLAAAIVQGTPWLGASCRQGAVAIVEADSPGSSLVPRLLALESRNPGLLNSQRIFFLPEPMLLAGSEQDLLTRIRDAEDGTGEMIRLVVLDSVTATMPEFGGGGMGGIDVARAWVRAARVLTEGDQRCVVGLAHVGKDAGRGILGSVALPAGLDFVLSLRPDSNDECLITTARERGGKARDWAACSARFKLVSEADSAVLEMTKPFSTDEHESPTQQKRKAPGSAAGMLLSAAKLMATAAPGRRAHPHTDWPLVGREQLKDAWATAARAANQRARTTPSLFKRMLDELVADGWLGNEGGGIYVV